MLLETLYRIYSIPGYNIAHVDVTAKLCEEHDIKYAGRRSRRGRRELARDAVSEPRLPDAAGRHRRSRARQHALLHARTASCKRGFPMLRRHARSARRCWS